MDFFFNNTAQKSPRESTNFNLSKNCYTKIKRESRQKDTRCQEKRI